MWQERCDEAARWIQRRTERLAEPRPPGFSPALQVPVPVVGRSPAGEPMLANEQFDDRILVDAHRARGVDLALRVDGQSMIDAGIAPGDLVLIEQDESLPPDGQLVAVFVEQSDAEATLKKFYREADHIRLEPANVQEPFRILMAGSVPEEPIRAMYDKRNPGRDLAFYSSLAPRVVGWVRDVRPGMRP